MTQQVTVYRWDDVGAPQITTVEGTANEVKAVLDAALVNGYGEKQPLGWTKEFDDVNGVIYSNNTQAGGSGGMIRFWPKVADWDSSLGDSGQFMQYEAAADFTSSSDGFKKGSTYVFKHPVRNSNVKAWVVIGTKTAFYFFLGFYQEGSTAQPFVMQSGTHYNFSMFAGDIKPTIQNDAHRFIAFSGASSGNSTSASWNNTFDSCAEGISTAKSDKQVKIWNADNSNEYGYYAIRAIYTGGSRSSAIPQTGNELLAYSECILSLDSYYNISDSINLITQPFFRGTMPGLINTAVGEGQKATWPYLRMIEGKSHWLLRNPSTGRSNFWINLEVW